MVPVTRADRLRSLAPANETLLARLPFTTLGTSRVGQASAHLRTPAPTRASRSEGTTRLRKHRLAAQASSRKCQFSVALIPDQQGFRYLAAAANALNNIFDDHDLTDTGDGNE